jgi:16S rRNA (cytidine1402-2'-O)-methyltransferase
MPGTLFVVATPIGNLEDITARALRVLREVSLIAAEDTRRTAKLLAHYGITTRTTSLHRHNETGKSEALVSRLLAGEDVALVSDAGTPTVSDPGHLLVKAAVSAGVRVEPIPGPSAIVALLSASGLSSDSFTFLGFPPTRSTDRKSWMDRVVASPGIVVFFEAPHRIGETLASIATVIGDVEGVMGRELTKTHEELVRGPISTLVKSLGEPKGEYVIAVVVGQTTNNEGLEAADDDVLAREVGQIANTSGVTKRQAINVVARRRGLRPNDVYAAVSKSRK